MSHAVIAWGRFNPPTEEGHGKLVKAVQDRAEKVGGQHYIFPTHTQDKKKNPMTHAEKVGAMRKLFPGSNVASHDKVKTIMDAMKHLEKKGHKEVTVVAGSDRVDEYHKLLNKYRKKEYPGIKKVNVISAGQRDPDAEGAEGMSASKLRGLVAAGKKDEFVSHYSDKKLGAHIHDKVKAAMQMESVSPVGIFLLGGPGSGKDYVLKNIFSRFDLTEVQADQILNGAANELHESKQNIVINSIADTDKIKLIQTMLEGYTFDFVHVSVTNKVSRLRNEQREHPLVENKRIDKLLKAEQLAKDVAAFVFNNSINLNESNQMEQIMFGAQIEKLLERLVNHGLPIYVQPEPKSFTVIKEKYFPTVKKDKDTGLPQKYVAGLSKSTAQERARHFKEKNKLSDSDPRAYEPAPGDATAKTKPSKHTLAVRKMMDEKIKVTEDLPLKLRRVPRSGNITQVMDKRKETGRMDEGAADKSLSAKAAKSGISIGKLRTIFKRGVAAWNSGHRPGTTPQQWGHARVNSYMNKGKTYYTADKDLREDSDIDELFEMQLAGADEYRKHAIAMTPGQGEPVDAFPVKSPNKKPVVVVTKPKQSVVSQYTSEEEHKNCGTPECCGECNQVLEDGEKDRKTFFAIRAEATETKKKVDLTPTLTTKRKKGLPIPPNNYNSTLHGLPVSSRFNAYEETEQNLPTLEEAIQYHVENKISFTENVFRPGSEMFFEMISEARRLYSEGKYAPKDEWEKDMLESNIGEIAEFEGQQVVLDYPIEEGLEECWKGYTQKGLKKKGNRMVPNCVPVNEEDKTDGKGIGKPWREDGGGAVYVRVGDGVRKISFSKSGMAKKYMDPAATRSFVARHRCLTNKDKTSRSYWACRWPRFFSKSGKIWW